MDKKEYLAKLNELNTLQRVVNELPTVSGFNLLKLLSEVNPDIIASCYTDEVKGCIVSCISTKITELKAEINAD